MIFLLLFDLITKLNAATAELAKAQDKNKHPRVWNIKTQSKKIHLLYVVCYKKKKNAVVVRNENIVTAQQIMCD